MSSMVISSSNATINDSAHKMQFQVCLDSLSSLSVSWVYSMSNSPPFSSSAKVICRKFLDFSVRWQCGSLTEIFIRRVPYCVGSGRLVATVRQGEQFLLRFLGRYQLLARHAGKGTVEEDLFLLLSDGCRPLFFGSGLTSQPSLAFSLM